MFIGNLRVYTGDADECKRIAEYHRQSNIDQHNRQVKLGRVHMYRKDAMLYFYSTAVDHVWIVNVEKLIDDVVKALGVTLVAEIPMNYPTE